MKKKIVSAFLIGVFAIAQMSSQAFGSEVTGVAGQIEVTAGSSSVTSSSGSSETVVNSTGNIFSDENSGSNILESSGLISSNVTSADLGEKIAEKGSDVIDIMKIVGRYFCVGGFIYSGIAMFCGLFGNKKALASGFIGLILSGVMYAAIVMSEDLVIMVASWAAA